MASQVTISLGYVPVLSVSTFTEAHQLNVFSSQCHDAPRAQFRPPNPDGIKAPAAPLSFAMGGNSSIGNFSPLTMSDMLSICSIQGGPTPRSYIFTQRSSLTAKCGSLALVLPSSGTLVMSSIAGSMVLASSDSSESATTVAPSPTPTPTPSLVPLPWLRSRTSPPTWASRTSLTRSPGQKPRNSSTLVYATPRIGRTNPRNLPQRISMLPQTSSGRRLLPITASLLCLTSSSKNIDLMAKDLK